MQSAVAAAALAITSSSLLELKKEYGAIRQECVTRQSELVAKLLRHFSVPNDSHFFVGTWTIA
jgi:hypothetical protein